VYFTAAAAAAMMMMMLITMVPTGYFALFLSRRNYAALDNRKCAISTFYASNKPIPATWISASFMRNTFCDSPLFMLLIAAVVWANNALLCQVYVVANNRFTESKQLEFDAWCCR